MQYEKVRYVPESGSTSQSFTIYTNNTHTSPTTVTITGTYNAASQSGTITVDP